MKAYMVEGSDPDNGADIVWAKNARDAKKQARYCDCCDGRYIDIRVKRASLLDDMEHKVPIGGHAWDYDEIRIILVRDYSWACIDPWNRPDECEKCSARQFCHWMED